MVLEMEPKCGNYLLSLDPFLLGSQNFTIAIKNTFEQRHSLPQATLGGGY